MQHHPSLLDTFPSFHRLEHLQLEFRGRKFTEDYSTPIEAFFDRNGRLTVVDVFEGEGYRTFRRGDKGIYHPKKPLQRWEEWTKYMG